MTNTNTFDAIVIGTGQAGKPLAGALARAGWRVAVVERGRVGGTCVISGCTPTKTMVASARVAYLARRGADYGVKTGPVTVDQTAVRERKRSIVDAWSASSRKGLERHDTLELIEGEASFLDARTVRVTSTDGPERRLRSDHILVNVGTHPSVPDIPGLGTTDFLDSTSIMELDKTPDHLVILGGGYIGLEFGQMFRRFGSRVTIVERGARLLPREDEDVSRELQQILEEDGINVHLGVEVDAVSALEAGIRVQWKIDGGDTSRAEGSHLLVAAGRVPSLGALDPDAAGLERTDKGFLKVNDRLETTVPGIWALGDVNGGPPFTHISYDDFRVVERNLVGDGGGSRSGRLVPYTLFTDPQLGRVGLSEREAREQGFDVGVACLPMKNVARAMEMDETRGFMKAVVDRSTRRILGAAILGVEGGEIMSVIQVAMMGDLPWTALRDGVFSHPTLAESLNNLFATLDDGK